MGLPHPWCGHPPGAGVPPETPVWSSSPTETGRSGRSGDHGGRLLLQPAPTWPRFAPQIRGQTWTDLPGEQTFSHSNQIPILHIWGRAWGSAFPTSCRCLPTLLDPEPSSGETGSSWRIPEESGQSRQSRGPRNYHRHLAETMTRGSWFGPIPVLASHTSCDNHTIELKMT